MNKTKSLIERQGRRERRVRAKLFGTAERPRLSVYRTNKYMYAQAINDEKGITVFSASTRGLSVKGNKTAGSSALGEAIAKMAKDKGVSAMIFDRGGYRYHGRVKAVADALRTAGITI
jgi:large subunit ribosomal protein L18